MPDRDLAPVDRIARALYAARRSSYVPEWPEAPAGHALKDGCLSDARIALDVIGAEFLVVPRSDIGTEYGCRYSDEGLANLTETPDAAISWALERRDWQRDAMHQLTAEAVQRPALPWTPIPLPEEPQS